MMVYESGLGIWVDGRILPEICYIIADFSGNLNLS